MIEQILNYSGSPAAREGAGGLPFVLTNLGSAEEALPVWRDPDVYGWLADDTSPPIEEFRIKTKIPDAVFLYGVFVHPDEPSGVLCFVPWTGTLLEVHVAAVPAIRGGVMLAACLQAIERLRKETPFEHLVTLVPTDNGPAFKLARAVGMVVEGRIPNSFSRGGLSLAQWLLGIDLI